MKKLLLIVGLLLPLPALALGLAEIDVRSGFNQKLDARIRLVALKSVEPSSIQARLADPDAFLRASIERPHLLTTLRFEVVSSDTGESYVRVTSKGRIREPAIRFIVDVQWPKGHARRAYSVLLRP